MSDLFSQSTRDALSSFAETWRNQGAWRFDKELRAFVSEQGGELEEFFLSGGKVEFSLRALFLRRWSGGAWYCAHRYHQLLDANFKFWVYHAFDCRDHVDLDGLVILPDHAFWVSYFPANGWWCSCHISGTRSIEVARRMGGDPEKQLPENWDQPDPETGRLRGIEEGFTTHEYPDLQCCLDAIRKGRHRRD